MKHPDETVREAVEEALGEANINLSSAVVGALALHLGQVLAANATHNLTAITDVKEAASLHVVDSLLALEELECAPPGRFADLGAGAGYPGIPLAIVSGRPVTLVESVGKKAEFLEGMAGRLAPFCELQVQRTRAELLALECGAVFSAVTARAVSALPSLVELASPLLVTDGLLIALKGRPAAEEVARGVAVAAKVAMTYSGVRKTTLPTGQHRAVIVFRRAGVVPEISVPRRPGMAQHKPLA